MMDAPKSLKNGLHFLWKTHGFGGWEGYRHPFVVGDGW